MTYFGDMQLGSTINFQFTTVGTTGAPTQLAGTTSTALSVYAQSFTTAITAGATLTTDFNGQTGLNSVSIVLTAGNGFTTANDYGVVLGTGTVGGTSVQGYRVGSFSVENRFVNKIGTAAITNAVMASGAITSATLAAGTITTGTFSNGAITSAVLATGSIHSTIFTTAAIVATTFATGAIVATTLAVGAIRSTTLAAQTLNSATFSAGTIGTSTFIIGALSSTVFAAGAITTTSIAGGVLPTNFSSMSISAAGLVAITSTIKKNTVATGFMFVMTDMTTHAPVAGLTVVATRSLDGAAFAACANSASNVSSGTYAINFAATDTNADHVMYRFTNATADDLNIEIITQP